MKNEIILTSLKTKIEGQILHHKTNIMVYLTNPVGIGEHSDVVGTVEGEIEKVAQYTEKLDVILSLLGEE